MAVLIVLFASWLVFRGIGALGVAVFATWQDAARYALAVMFVFTGIAHFNRIKHDLARMVPPAIPKPLAVIYATGVLEFAGAAGLLLTGLMRAAGIWLAVMLIALFPANVYAAQTEKLQSIFSAICCSPREVVDAELSTYSTFFPGSVKSIARS